MMQKRDSSYEEILAEIRSKPTVPLWPHAGMAYGLGKSATYKAAHAGEIEVMRLGRLLKAVTAPMRARLGLSNGPEAR
jgi:hypothetical protein